MTATTSDSVADEEVLRRHNRLASSMQHLRTRADDDVVADRRMALLPALLARRPGAAEGHPMIERAIIADLGGFADHDAHAVIDEQAAADARPGVDLDPGQYPPDMRHEAAGQIPAVLPQPMREAIIEQSLKPGIAQHDFEPRSGRRIARQSRIYLVSQVSEKHCSHYVIVRIPVGRYWRAATRGTPRTAYNCPTNAIKYEGERGESIAEEY